MHQASVPVLARGLRNLAEILRKAEAHCEAKKIDPQAFLQSRLYPDMFPLTRQVQIAGDMAKGAAARLAGAEVPSFPDTEASFAELLARIDRTVAFIEGFTAAQIDGSEQRPISIPLRDRTVSFDGQTYLTTWVLPNFYFHLTTAYALLRHGGVELGKRDFLGAH
ncbi:MAG: hypothetical protein RI907_2541 [Pseudomonadota bacterium]|jgi:hypothetical protein